MSDTPVNFDANGIPTKWYNVMADLTKRPPAPLHPGTKEVLKPEDLKHLFPAALIEQEMGIDRWIEIPEEVRQIYAMWRPTPLRRALRLEKLLNTPARIYFKYEGASPVGSHKSNTAAAQAYYNKREGIKCITTETGAGQWGSAMAQAGKLFDLDVRVFMVRSSCEQKPYRRVAMETWGAKVVTSPSEETEAGRRILESDSEHPGSLGVAISEAVEYAAEREDTHYALGSVLNHVLLHQTVIGLEAKQQLQALGEFPSVIATCCGGGSNFGGMVFPFIPDKLAGKNIRAIATEPETCPTLTKGELRYDFGDRAGLTPLMMMHTLGHEYLPPTIHAGGLRYHGMSPLVSTLLQEKLIEAKAYGQLGVFEAALTFARTEGIIPAPESAHAIKAIMEEALRCRDQNQPECLLFCLSGHGFLDLGAYADYLSGNLSDGINPEDMISDSLARVPHIPIRWEV